MESSALAGRPSLVRGPAGFSADAATVFEGINSTLLYATAGLVFVLLVLIYRSPIFWALPLFAVVLAEAVVRGLGTLLAEAGVPYDLISDLDEINAEFDTADVALVIGANDVVNPVARTDKGSPIYGMPILNADKAKNVLVIKRGQGAGFSGIENHLFYLDNTRMVYGDAQKVAAELIHAVKAAG